MNVLTLLTMLITVALALCGVAAWLTGNMVALLPGIALLPGLAFVISRSAGSKQSG